MQAFSDGKVTAGILTPRAGWREGKMAVMFTWRISHSLEKPGGEMASYM